MNEAKPIRTVLVANRGEIARRLITACRTLGMRAYAVASEPDYEADWHRDAHDVIPLKGATAAETYLDAELIVKAALSVSADALHPGYGFLSENADFAEMCARAGIVFVGPSPAAMRAMGSKIEAIRIARETGVPTVPGVSGAGADDSTLELAASEIGYPVLIKASAGGGGRGMRLVREESAFAEGLEAARAEAASAFGDPTVLLEKYFESARHVEVQVLADGHGNVVHLFERECSIQRRYQKIIEESPAPGIDPSLRVQMTAAAVALARQVGYESAGTVEFLVDDNGGFYFLEMNTRLQVEHPVTEAVTGLDLAAWQLRIAAGEELDFRQSDVTLRGHAIECRVYAEDPSNGFMPSVGQIAEYRAPRGPGVRCDDGVAKGSTITPHYDAMIAKVVAAGADRNAAIERALLALSDMVVLGVTTNIPYLSAILGHNAFRDGRTDTRFLERHLSGWRLEDELDESTWIAAAALEAFGLGRTQENGDGRDADGSGDRTSPWTQPALSGWRVGG